MGLIALPLVALGVGLLIGAVGVGGILLIPALAALARLEVHEAMATALFTFIFTGLAGTFQFQRRGSIDWPITFPVCAGAAFSGFLGALANSRIEAPVLSLLLSGVIVFAGIYTLSPWGGSKQAAFAQRPRIQQALLLGIGAVAGFGSGLTGVGGPALSVPMMVLFGFPVLATIGASQVIQILAAVSGTLGNLRYGSVDFPLAALITLFEVAGVLLGVRIVHAVNTARLRRFVAWLCIAVGAGLSAKAIGGF